MCLPEIHTVIYFTTVSITEIQNYSCDVVFVFCRDGNLPDIGRAGSLHEFLMELHEEYGSIASFWMGEKLVVSIASPELFKQHLSVFDRPRMFVI